MSSASADRWDTSQTARRTSAPAARSSSASSVAPGASAPRRPARTRSRTPWAVTRWRATAEPMTPVPPVTRKVPCPEQGAGASASGAVRTRRGTKTSPPRTAISVSWSARAAPTAVQGMSAGSAPGARSSSANRSGCSERAERTRPCTAAWTGSAPSPGCTSTAPLVRTVSRAGAEASCASHAWMCARAWPTWARTPSRVSVPPSPAQSRSTVSVPASASREVSGPQSRGASLAAASRATAFLGSQASVNSDSATTARLGPTGVWETGRSTSSSMPMTGVPVASAIRTRTAAVPVVVRQTRTVRAPLAHSRTPDQANGSREVFSASSTTPPRPMPCRAASSRAGWMPKPVTSSAAPSGSSTSA